MANRIYELMYIANPESTDDVIAGLNEGITKVFTDQGGTVVRIDDWGKRKLAYKIDKKTEGHYVLFELEGSGKEIAELERRMRVNDAIIRFMTIRVDEERKAAEKRKAKAEKNLKKRASSFSSKSSEATIKTEEEES